MVISRAEFPIDDDVFAPYQVIGELGARPTPLYVARQSALAGGGAQLVVAEHFPDRGKTGEGPGRFDLRREARRISTLASPHIARVREVAVRGDDLVVFGEFLDGEKLTEFWRPDDWLPLDIALRILLDVLTGVGALHGLRDSNQQPMKLTHGEISPATILFGSDGVARVLHAVARRAADATAEAASQPYLAPEVLSNDAYDGRADVFSVGVLLWEILEGKRLTSDGDEAAGLRVRSGPLPAPSAPEKTAWAKALVPVATKALAAAPEDRWATAAAMAGEIRKAAGLKLAAASASAAFAKSKFGERVKARRARWESRSSRAPMPMASPRPAAALPASLPVSAISTALLGPTSVAPLSVPFARSEEFSSSVLESYRPPPPPLASVAAPARLDGPGAAHVDPADAARLDALLDGPGVARFDAPVARFAPPSGAPGGSPLSIPPLEAPPVPSIPEPPPSAEALVPFEAPVVFDDAEAAPVVSPFGEPSPMPPALSSSDAPAAPRSRRRRLVLGGVAALGIATASLIVVRASHHASPLPVAAAAAVPAPAAPGVSADLAPAASVNAAAPQLAAPAAPPVSSAHAPTPKTKAGPKTKGPAVGGSHPKSAPVRPQTHAKPGST